MGLNIIKNDAVELTSGEKKTLNLLKKIYENVTREVFLYSQPVLNNLRPDFLVLDSQKGISIIEVKDWSKSYIQDANKINVILQDREEKNPLYKMKEYIGIIKGLLTANTDIFIKNEENISGNIIFTNMSWEDAIEYEYIDYLENKSSHTLFSDDLNKLIVENLFEDIEDVNMTNEELAALRTLLFPEIKITKILDNAGNGLDIKALDKEQEDFARRIPYGHYMVSGIPGSGKTVILVTRALHLIKENPNWKVLILTYNKALQKKLQTRLDILANEIKNNRLLESLPIDNIQILRFHQLTNMLAGHSKKPEDMKDAEWWDNGIVKIALGHARPMYDAILIDEYQDFHDDWIRLCIKCCEKYEIIGNNKNVREVVNLFLAGDRLQSIYNYNDVSWKSIGIDMRGRSKLLKTSYRSANEHLMLALEFLREEDKLKKEVLDFYKEEDESDININNLSNDGMIEFIDGDYNSISHNIKYLIEDLEYKYNDILILCKSKDDCDKVKSVLDNKYSSNSVFVKDAKGDEIDTKMLLSTYHSSKGLESKVAILVNVDKFKKNEKSKQNDIESRKLLYVGMTRACERLYIHADSYEKDSFAKIIKGLYENSTVQSY
ncbi:3'-5' exonuclease [Clostridioides difficile]|nr:3'-5' exonuclease [Clostridioides difficile]